MVIIVLGSRLSLNLQDAGSFSILCGSRQDGEYTVALGRPDQVHAGKLAECGEDGKIIRNKKTGKTQGLFTGAVDADARVHMTRETVCIGMIFGQLVEVVDEDKRS